MKTCFEKPEMVLKWFSQPEASPYKRGLESLRTDTIKKLREARETYEIFRAQGKLDLLEDLLRLEEELREVKQRSMGVGTNANLR